MSRNSLRSRETCLIVPSDLLDKKLASIAPDIMDMKIEVFTDIINRYPNKLIGLALMNQKIISGIGNYLRADILWMAKVSPFRHIKDLESTDINRIYKSIVALTWGDYDYELGHVAAENSEIIIRCGSVNKI